MTTAQTPRDDSATPRFTELVVVRPTVQADFDARVLGYFDLRTTLEDGLPAQHVTANPRRISTSKRSWRGGSGTREPALGSGPSLRPTSASSSSGSS
jgi:hypothetical protein